MTRTPVFDEYGQVTHYTNPAPYVPTEDRAPINSDRMRWELAVFDWPNT